MNISARGINSFLLFKLPAAYFCGVRTRSINESSCLVTVKYRWINTNPFRSMYWAVQGMAAELAGGVLVMKHIKNSGRSISMLIARNEATFYKKARGRIRFECRDGDLVRDAIKSTLATGEGQTLWMRSVGIDENGDMVSDFRFEWTIKLRSKF